MTKSTLHESQSRLLGALTLTSLKHLGESAIVVDGDNSLCSDWRMARLAEVVLLEKPADNHSPKRIDCYLVTKHSIDGAAFKLDPARLVYSLHWQHKGEPPDLHLELVQAEPQGWVNTANLMLLGELRRRALHTIDWTGMPDVIPLVDAFEEARASHGY
jgi:hypothetical protein